MSKHKKHKNTTHNNSMNNSSNVVSSEETIDTVDEEVEEEMNDIETVVEVESETIQNTEEVVDETPETSDITEEEVVEPEQEIIDEGVVNETTTEASNIIEEEVVETVVSISEEPEVAESVETPVVTEVTHQQVINFYKVGTNFINGKCVNQITATSDLVMAKSSCESARDTNKKSYHVFDKDGTAVYTSEYNIPKDNYYRVGTDWKNGKCINQQFSSVNRDEACDSANINTKKYGVVHHVYDPTGKIIFSAKTKLTLFAKKKRGANDVNRYIK